jgi:SAM-dependent methyltransferase
MDHLMHQIDLELEDIREDIACTELATSCQRAADFGCGSGLSTICLFLELGARELKGVDKDEAPVQAAVKHLEALKLASFSNLPQQGEDDLLVQMMTAIGAGRLIGFSVANVLSSAALPKNLDLGFCRRLLTPIHQAEYGNPESGMDSALGVLRNLTATIVRGGQLLIVEKRAIDFRSAIESSGLRLQRLDYYSRHDIGTSGRVTLYKTDYARYVCEKL